MAELTKTLKADSVPIKAEAQVQKEPLKIELGDGKFDKPLIRIASLDLGGVKPSLKYESIINYINSGNLDIVCLQELKTDQKQFYTQEIDKIFSKTYIQYPVFCRSKTGYSGCVVLSKVRPLRIDFEIPNHDQEGRVITMEFEKFILVAVSVPTSGVKLVRIEYRTNFWDPDFREFLKSIKSKGKPAILCGNFNVAHQDIDLAFPAVSEKLAGFTLQERKNFIQILKDGWVDVFRELHPTDIKYSYQKNRFNKKQEISGWRVDYFLVLKEQLKNVKECFINSAIEGSDHAPVELKIQLD